MLQKKITGRTGNQMFQYAALRAYMEKYKDYNLKLNFDVLYKHKFSNDLKNFNIYNYEENNKLILSIKQKCILFFVRITEIIIRVISLNNKKKYTIKCNNFQNIIENKLIKNGIYYKLRGYTEFKASKEKNKVFIGYFESPKYFNDIKDIIKKEFTPKYQKLEKNKELYQKIENSESVCISIRRGDFLSKKNKKMHYICNEKYFEQAIEIIKRKIKNPQFFIFSDDIEWVKNNMRFPSETQYEDGNDPIWEKLRLMYSCKHFIISNSTFSWWAQYLSSNKEKIVVAPSRWKNTYHNEDLYEDDWILITPE